MEANINFNIIDKKFNSTNKFDFGLRYWPSYCNYKHQSSSGAYAFRPIDRLFYSMTYSNFQSGTYIQGTFMQKLVLYFSKNNKKTGEKEMEAIVHVTLDQDLDVVRFDVDLDSLPVVYLDGYEVVAHFNAHDFDNNQTFYTDSNGLEMLERKLNYRHYYDIYSHMYKYNHQNITANYYPINSAIAIKEVNGPRQFTVSNSRSQGGSALDPGQMELMQNRRIPCDDQKGEAEFLNETDSTGNGIRVPATYYVQLSNLNERPSQQRMVQQKNADPVQFMYARNMSMTRQVSSKVESSKDYMTSNNNEVFKVVKMPLAKNKVMLRLQNLDDKFDTNSGSVNISLTQYAQQMWKEANPEATTVPSADIIETSVTGNIKVEDMEKRRINWMTKTSKTKKELPSLDLDNVTLLPQ